MPRVAASKTFFDFLAVEAADGEWSRPNPGRFKRHAGKRPQRLPRDPTRHGYIAQVWAQIAAPWDRAWVVFDAARRTAGGRSHLT